MPIKSHSIVLLAIIFSLCGLWASSVNVAAQTQTYNEDVAISATVVSVTEDLGGGGGGGGGSSSTSIELSGWAYPLSHVSLLKDGQLAVTTLAGPDAKFFISIDNLNQGNYTFSIYSEDDALRRSTIFTFPVYITNNITTTISGIFLSPTIGINKSEVRWGDTLTIFGQTVPSSSVTIQVNSEIPHFFNTLAATSGVYLYNLDTSILEFGDHTTKSKSTLVNQNQISPFGELVNFKVGTENVLVNPDECIPADLNCDGNVNLVDFSIMAYWYSRINPPTHVDLSHDGVITLVDFSIIAYYWTG
jgi:hypothetical protein